MRRATDADTPLHGAPDNFYPRSPCGERPNHEHTTKDSKHFYPRSPCGERPITAGAGTMTLPFLSTLSLRRATAPFRMAFTRRQPFLSTLSLRRATTLYCPPFGEIKLFLSTLSLRRATVPCWALYSSSRYFYPRSPCGERQQSRPPASRRTNFYPRSPCGERLRCPANHRHQPVISIHALLAESDQGCGYCYLWALAFLSTLSLRRATAGQNVPFGCIFRYFYPRSPCGERHLSISII